MVLGISTFGISQSTRLKSLIGILIYLIKQLNGVNCFNIDIGNETFYVAPSSITLNESVFFGYSFTLSKHVRLGKTTTSFARLLIGAPKSKRQSSVKRVNSSAKEAIYECNVAFSIHTKANYSIIVSNSCKATKAFKSEFHPEELYSASTFDAMGLSVSSLNGQSDDLLSTEFSRPTDTVCRPLHSHHCGNSPQLEGGCLLSGFPGYSDDLRTKIPPNNELDLTWEERYEAANLQGKWSIVNPCKTDCQSFTFIDLMFVIDGSASIRQSNFNLMLRWIKNVSMGFNISGPVKIGVVQYSHWSSIHALNKQKLIKTEISLGNYTNRTEFNAAIDAIKYQRSSTYTAHAINKTVLYDFNSPEGRYPDAGRIMILLTDGKSTDGKYLPYSARLASEQGVISYAVGVGPNYDPKELRIIAGTDRRVFEVAKFTGLDEIVNGVQQSIAQSLEGGAIVATESAGKLYVSDEQLPLLFCETWPFHTASIAAFLRQ